MSCSVQRPLPFLSATNLSLASLSGTLPLPWSLATCLKSPAPVANIWGPCLFCAAPQGRKGPTTFFLELSEPVCLCGQASLPLERRLRWTRFTWETQERVSNSCGYSSEQVLYAR